jgi:hypothetical protein
MTIRVQIPSTVGDYYKFMRGWATARDYDTGKREAKIEEATDPYALGRAVYATLVPADNHPCTCKGRLLTMREGGGVRICPDCGYVETGTSWFTRGGVIEVPGPDGEWRGDGGETETPGYGFVPRPK